MEESAETRRQVVGHPDSSHQASSASSVASGRAALPPGPEMLQDLHEPIAPSSEGSRDPASSPKEGSARPSLDDSATGLTEQALKQLNLTSLARRGKPSSTGGTTANTRPTDIPDVPEAGDAAEVADPPVGPQPPVEGVSFAVPEEMPQGTPPPVPEGLPVVSLQDIAVMEQKKGMRGRRVKSRRGSTTASHASLSAIPENVEITPLHARTNERSDSMRERVSLSQQGVNRLADVAELEVESKSNTIGNTSRPSHADSPRSSSSILTSGDDSVMPVHVVEHEYDMHMPVLPHPRAYWRIPNATEAYRTTLPQRLALSAQSPVLTSAQSSGQSDGGLHTEQVLTDDSGLVLTGSTVTYSSEDDTATTSATFSSEQLQLEKSVAEDKELGIQACPEVQQGTVQQETIFFRLHEAVEGLRCVKKYAVGELSWEQAVQMGDYSAGEHSFSFSESPVPTGMLNLGQYRMKTIFMDAHGKYLWAGMHNFRVVKASPGT